MTEYTDAIVPKLNPNNVFKWGKDMEMQQNLLYPLIQDTLANKYVPVTEVLTKADCYKNGATTDKHVETMINEHLKIGVEVRYKQKTQLNSLFTKMVSRIGTESMNILQLRDEWNDVIKSKDPIKLWVLIKVTHKPGGDLGSETENRVHARRLLFDLKQQPNETLTDFKEKFDEYVENLEDHLKEENITQGSDEDLKEEIKVKKVKKDSIPENELAIMFLDALNTKMYGNEITVLKQQITLNNKEFSRAQIVGKLPKLMRDSGANTSVSGSRTNRTVFSMDEEKVETPKKQIQPKTEEKRRRRFIPLAKRMCYNCEELGHLEYDCPLPKKDT
jgi:hypothetical protein